MLKRLMTMLIGGALTMTGSYAFAQNVTAVGEQQPALGDDVLLDKVGGALYGKCIGLMLGQPVEGWTKERIEEKASKVGAYPVEFYFPKDFDSKLKRFLSGNFDRFWANDDTMLMMLGLIVLRERGLDFAPRDLAEVWVKHVGGACTAEGVGLQNFKENVWPPESAIHRNPYNQWIGAQMRADIWGMIAPGAPEVAADFAKRDACITHVLNGVYGAQYMAAMISLAMTEKDMRSVVLKALKTIPEHSDYGRAIADVVACYDAGGDWQSAWRTIDDRYGWNDDGRRSGDFVEACYNTKTGMYQWRNQKWVHAVPNGALCAMALLYGKGDFGDSICIAAMSGYDADCNAGNVGAVAGAFIGAKAIPSKWKNPLNDRFETGLKDFPKEMKISELAAEIASFAKRTPEWNAAHPVKR